MVPIKAPLVPSHPTPAKFKRPVDRDCEKAGAEYRHSRMVKMKFIVKGESGCMPVQRWIMD